VLFGDEPLELKDDYHRGDVNSSPPVARAVKWSGFLQLLFYLFERGHFCLMSVSFFRKLCRGKLQWKRRKKLEQIEQKQADET
jgi:hypothetical protein